MSCGSRTPARRVWARRAPRAKKHGLDAERWEGAENLREELLFSCVEALIVEDDDGDGPVAVDDEAGHPVPFAVDDAMGGCRFVKPASAKLHHARETLFHEGHVESAIAVRPHPNGDGSGTFGRANAVPQHFAFISSETSIPSRT